MSKLHLPPEAASGKVWEMSHFPARFQFVIFRNWNRIKVENIAAVLQTSCARIFTEAERLGLRKYDEKLCDDYLKKGYLTIIRENWHILNYRQLLQLLGFSEEKLYRILMDEDFMFHKMGDSKPFCPEIRWEELSDRQLEKTAEIKAVISPLTAIDPPEKEFAFFAELEKPTPPATGVAATGNLRMVYSFCAAFGDNLLPGAPDPFPEGMLAQYQASGINAVWYPVLLASVVPWTGDEDYSADWQIRQKTLQQMTAKLARYGIKLFLYLNEPRFFPPEIAARHPEWIGPANQNNSGTFAVCINNPEVESRLQKGITDLCNAIPDIGGFMTITMSENLTHCLSRLQKDGCPRCAALPSPAPNVVKVLNTIARGIRNSAANPRLIAWNWGWLQPWDMDVLEKLPDEAELMCVSETGLKTDCHGIEGEVYDYSISHPGPGPVATRLWEKARQCNRKIIAKMQLNASWELSSLPFIPVPQLAKKHLDNLAAIGIDNFVFSWTLGGSPGGNMKLADRSLQQWCEEISALYPEKIEKACQHFSDGFAMFPFHGASLIYSGPQNFGCGNLVYAEPSGRRATMVGFPFDDMYAWTHGWHYPKEIMAQAFREMTAEWKKGLDILHRIAPEHQGNANFTELLNMAEAGFCIICSSANLMTYYNLRDSGSDDREQMIGLLKSEEMLARKMLTIQQRDSRIGFEASNHYMYGENTLLEKIINCRDILLNHFGVRM